MRALRTKGTLLKRLERLESRSAACSRTIRFRFGNLKRLPRDYHGERHIIVTRELPKRGDREWVEFEEVPWPDPDPPQRRTHGSPHRIDIMFVKAYPDTEPGIESWRDELPGDR